MVFLFARYSSGRRPVFRLDSGRSEVTVVIAAAAAERAEGHHDSGGGTTAGAPTRTRRRPSRPNPRLSNPPGHVHGELVAVGWPAWLVEIAAEAISGWTPRAADTFDKIAKLGQGTYGNVYKARDRLSGKIMALKKVRFDNLEPESVKFMAREILILRRLDHPNVIKLEGLVTARMECSLFLLFEFIEHDLAGLVEDQSVRFTDQPQVKCYMKQLLLGLEHCHERHVIHRDIKCSNLLIDSQGVLKIADFGVASFFDPNHKLPMTSKVGTLWYRSPELLLGATEYGIGVDLWGAGCVLAELLAGKPLLPGLSEVEQLHKIFELCGCPKDYLKKTNLPIADIFKSQQSDKCIRETFKDFPPSSLPLLENLLSIDPVTRQTATAALISDFFTTEPAACDPYSLPSYNLVEIVDLPSYNPVEIVDSFFKKNPRMRGIEKTDAAEILSEVIPEDQEIREFLQAILDIPADALETLYLSSVSSNQEGPSLLC